MTHDFDYLIYADAIIENLQLKYINKKIDKFNSKLSDSLKGEITKRVLKDIWIKPNVTGLVEQAKLDVAKRLQDLVEEGTFEEHVSLEGFLQFRMKDYLSLWDRSIDNVIDEMIEESAYNEFIHVLKSYIELNPSMCDVCNIFFEKGQFVLKDTDGNVIPLKSIDDSPWFSYDMTTADQLLSTLLNICPMKIIIHSNGKKMVSRGLIQTIIQIFEGRVEFI